MANDSEAPKRRLPAQSQRRQPGREKRMVPRPEFIRPGYRGSDKLVGKVALITGGDSGIGRAVAVHFAREGADVVIGYLDEHADAAETVRLVQREGRRAIAVAGDIGDARFCARLIEETLGELGKIDILVNNAGEHHPSDDAADLTPERIERTFRTNVLGAMFLTVACLPHLKKGACILNTASVTAYRGSGHLVDYAATKGALVAFTRSLSEQLVARGIRVNGVAPGPIWTPLIPASFTPKEVAKFGTKTPMGRAGQPSEVAPAFVFLASSDASYISGQFIHPNGGEMTGS